MKKQAKRGTLRLKVKRGDDVVFTTGKEFNRYDGDGKRTPYRGKVIAVDPRNRKVKVEGAMIVKKHQKADPRRNVEGGILKREAWVDVSNISIADPKTGDPTRIGYEVRDGKKVRIAKKSGEIIPEPGRIVKPKKEEAPEQAEEAKTEEKPAEKPKPKKKKAIKETKAAEDKKGADDKKEEKE